MLLIAAKVIVVSAALYFLVLGVVALLYPRNARSFLLGFADSSLKHYLELVVRMLVGGSLLLVAQSSPYAIALAAFGWILVISTAFLAVMPWRLHQRFARSAVPQALRFLPLIGVSSLALGVALLWSGVLATK